MASVVVPSNSAGEAIHNVNKQPKGSKPQRLKRTRKGRTNSYAALAVCAPVMRISLCGSLTFEGGEIWLGSAFCGEIGSENCFVKTTQKCGIYSPMKMHSDTHSLRPTLRGGKTDRGALRARAPPPCPLRRRTGWRSDGIETNQQLFQTTFQRRRKIWPNLRNRMRKP